MVVVVVVSVFYCWPLFFKISTFFLVPFTQAAGLKIIQGAISNSNTMFSTSYPSIYIEAGLPFLSHVSEFPQETKDN